MGSSIKDVGSFLAVFDTGRSLSEDLLFAEHGENMLCTKIVLSGLSLEFSCIELVIQRTICRHIVGELMQK